MIKIDTLGFTYPRSRAKVFDGLNLTLEPGKVYGLLGKNGTGKSTMLSLISGVLTPRYGTVTVNGVESHRRKFETMEKLFFLPEDFALPRLTPQQFARLYGKLYPKFSRQQFDILLHELEVDADIKFHAMSLGQRKKAYIAFALACNTDYLLMDEPTNGLDIPSKAIFRRLVAAIAGGDRTIIISTHQVRDMEELIDHILILDGKDLLINASSEEITRKLRFAQIEDRQTSLYYETTVMGEVGVTLLQDGETETQLNIELLFNAAMANGEQVKQLFKKQDYEK